MRGCMKSTNTVHLPKTCACRQCNGRGGGRYQLSVIYDSIALCLHITIVTMFSLVSASKAYRFTHLFHVASPS